MNDSHRTPSSSTSGTAAAPAVTPALRAWIVEQAQANVAAPALLESMLSVGWDKSVALDAIETTLRAHLGGLAHPQDALRVAGVPVPEPALQSSPGYIDAGDRRVNVLLSMHQPRIVLLGNFLSEEECDALIVAARPRLGRSLTVATQTAGEEINAARTSNGMFFQRGESALVQTIEERIARVLHWPIENGEGLQVLHYRPGAQYQPHYDYFDPAEPSTSGILRRGGQRVGTLVLYLNTPEQGGSTTFPGIQLEVVAQRGNAV
ncbi:MAG: 2OG-Fe(II) oxygenase, partial [Burkholderiaceae bacterium]|nr:2OG-Fe(II) oxygenase [Burkholderiaceae bacterium]